MRKTIVAAVAAFVLGAISTGVVISWAQPARPPGPPPGPPGAADGPTARGPWMGHGPFGERMHEQQARRSEIMQLFALIHRPEDRQLTPADVRKIAEAFLLWNGNHTWKVINVKPEGDVIGFDLATADGSVIASYTMDPKTGHPARKA